MSPEAPAQELREGTSEVKPLQDLVARKAMVLGDASDDGRERPHLEGTGTRNRLVMLAVPRRPDADVGARLPDRLVAQASELTDETVGVEIAR